MPGIFFNCGSYNPVTLGAILLKLYNLHGVTSLLSTEFIRNVDYTLTLLAVIQKCDHAKIYQYISDQNLELMRERLMDTVIWPSDDTNTEKIG